MQDKNKPKKGHDLNRMSAFKANLDSLETNLRNRLIAGVDSARNSLTCSVQIEMNELNHLYLQDMREVYSNIGVVNHMATTAIIGSIAIAHSYALENIFDEGKRKIESLQDWHTKFRAKLEQPLLEKPLWLSQLNGEQRQGCRQMVCEHRALPEGFAYIQANINFCKEHALTMDDLSNMVEGDSVAVLSFV